MRDIINNKQAMKKAFITFAVFGMLAAGLVLFSAAPAEALTIAPPTFDYSLNPGDTVLDVVKLFNESPEPLTVYPILKNFTSDKKEKGEPQFYDADKDPDGNALAKWITVSVKPITLAPQQRGNLEFAINVPKDGAQPGGHYGVILLSTIPPSEAGKVGIASQIGALILVNVSGQVSEAGTIAEFGFVRKQLWYNYLPVDLFLRFENDGNTHLRPTGDLVITNWYGRQVASLKVNEDFRSVLPKSIRRFGFGWQRSPVDPGDPEIVKEWKNFAFGKYKAMLILTYGSKNQVLTETREFFVWPWRLIAAFAAGALILIALLVLLVRSYNKAIIRKYELVKKKDQ